MKPTITCSFLSCQLSRRGKDGDAPSTVPGPEQKLQISLSEFPGICQGLKNPNRDDTMHLAGYLRALLETTEPSAVVKAVWLEGQWLDS